MKQPQHSLRQIQNWMQSVVMHPGGVEQGMHADAAKEHLDLDAEQVEQVIARSKALDSVARLEIYSHAYFARLLECLRAEFPMLVRAMGEELFDQFAVDYLQNHPSQSYTLGELGRRFAAHLRATQPPAETDDRPFELGFLIDLAELEWQFSQVFDGPGVENERLLDAEAIRAIAPEQWPSGRLQCVPCLRLVQFDYPVQHYWRALRDSVEASPPERGKTFLAITRRDYVVRHVDLTPVGFAILSAIQAGETISQAIASAVKLLPTNDDALAVEVRDGFEHWTREHFFKSWTSPE